METLKHGDYVKDYPEVKEELEKKFDNLEGITITVEENYKKEIVELRVGNGLVVLTISQARNLAKHIRMAANRLERDMRSRGIKVKK